jgi:GNAT superfamily N-acetyltransferase
MSPGASALRLDHNKLRPMPAPTIRSALPSDEAAWRSLWRGYVDFYAAKITDDVTNRTWKRILDPDSAVMCIVAEIDGKVCGFANCVVHENTWESQPVCYLEDLYVDPAARGHGIGWAIVDWLRNAMRAEGWARLYWHTRESNAQARRLYDRFGEADDFVRYVIKQK